MEKFIGCSGFHYGDWKDKFYPEDISKDRWLEYYSQHFNSVEINNTFYKIPEKDALKSWIGQTPADFRFSVKGSRYITHMKKLKDSDIHVKKFYKAVDPLKEKLGAVLWQLPGNLHRNDKKIETFCKELDNSFTNVIEFRHISWFNKEIYELLSSYDVAVCSLSAPGDLPELFEDSAGKIYLRFHGKEEWYRYHYSEKELEEWKNKIQKSSAEICYAYFNNDYKAYAVENGIKMKELL
ncbi:MAG: DUF72 domain-containing protein [Bacteroidota bacterium]|nr:DUF72 domain-containing protein [Bacteroidota bacterium]